MTNVSIIYYTNNKIRKDFAIATQNELIKVAADLPIITVSHKPMVFGDNICVGEIGSLIYNIYKQIFIGAQAAKTKYIACVEDDCLYTREHFCLQPPDDTIYYNMNRWSIDPRGFYYHRRRMGMWQCVAPRQLIVDALEERFKKYPEPFAPKTPQPAEPGKHDEKFGLTPRKFQILYTNLPIVTFNHRPSMGGLRKILKTDEIKKDIPYWGNAVKLWERIYGSR